MDARDRAAEGSNGNQANSGNGISRSGHQAKASTKKLETGDKRHR